MRSRLAEVKALRELDACGEQRAAFVKLFRGCASRRHGGAHKRSVGFVKHAALSSKERRVRRRRLA